MSFQKLTIRTVSNKMKLIIVASLPKAGTKTMQVALTKLVYKVDDYEQNYLLLGDI